uniref:Uncharacterized protein n=1 Tax=viral metagenome TaxID=1070528 RepID=A0A6M3LAM0_9ZZZZ
MVKDMNSNDSEAKQAQVYLLHFDSRLARNPVQRIGTKGVKANDEKPVQ